MDNKEIYEKLIEEIKDYFNRNNIKKAVIGLSGGIDSSLSAKLVSDAIGKENIYGLIMPLKGLSAEEHTNDAIDLCKLIGVKYSIIDIKHYLVEFEKVDRFRCGDTCRCHGIDGLYVARRLEVRNRPGRRDRLEDGARRRGGHRSLRAVGGRPDGGARTKVLSGFGKSAWLDGQTTEDHRQRPAAVSVLHGLRRADSQGSRDVSRQVEKEEMMSTACVFIPEEHRGKTPVFRVRVAGGRALAMPQTLSFWGVAKALPPATQSGM